jgi:hypothetical protein
MIRLVDALELSVVKQDQSKTGAIGSEMWFVAASRRKVKQLL